MRSLRVTVIFAILLAIAPVASAASLSLNFGASSFPSFGTTGNLTMSYPAVAPGINATLTAASVFTSFGPANNGSVLGDIRANASNTSSVSLQLSLWDAAAGTGYSNLYNPGTSYDITYGFYDIDGGAGTFDLVTLYTPGSYTVTSTSSLLITTSPGQISFSGAASPEVAGQNGLTSFNPAQADVAMLFKVNNTSVLDFNYTVGVSGTPIANGRNLLLDGDDLTGSLDAYSPITETFVPEPASLSCLGVMAGLLLRRARPFGRVYAK